MRKEPQALFIAGLILMPLIVAPTNSASPRPPSRTQNEPKSPKELVKEVRHVLVMLPYYSVFDNLAYRVEGTK